MYHFATLFDKNYLSRGLVLYNSLKKHCELFELYILCLDENTSDFFQKNNEYYPEIKPFSLSEIEEYDNELKECKRNRNTIEYYFTLSPCLPLYLLEKYNVPHICSLDADIMFFSSPAVIFSYLKDYSVLITPHSFSAELKSLEIWGIYNVSFQIFKNDDIGLLCLKTWRKQCIDWCYDKFEDGKFADQKYLDTWTCSFNKVYSIDILGTGVAPWNMNSYPIRLHKSQIYINNSKLIFYHYHGLRIIGQNLIMHGLDKYSVKKSKKVIRYIYKPYIKKLLSYKLSNDNKIERYSTISQSTLKTILFQRNWFYYKFGILFENNKLIELLGRSIICFKK